MAMALLLPTCVTCMPTVNCTTLHSSTCKGCLLIAPHIRVMYDAGTGGTMMVAREMQQPQKLQTALAAITPRTKKRG